MRRVALAGVWLALFGATIGARLACTALRTSRSVAATVANDDAIHKELDSVLRRPGVKFRDINSDMDSRIDEYLGRNSDGLRRCRREVMQRSKRSVEYFEISFDLALSRSSDQYSPSMVSTSARDIAPARIGLLHPLVERSTIQLTAEERQCIASEFSKMSFEFKDTPSPPATEATGAFSSRSLFRADNEDVRSVYQICFRALKPQEI
jgi:hypothetical protein